MQGLEIQNGLRLLKHHSRENKPFRPNLHSFTGSNTQLSRVMSPRSLFPVMNSQMAKRLISSLNRKTAKLNSGAVIAVGPGARDRDCNLIPVNVKEGDRGLLLDHVGMEVRLGDKGSYRHQVGSFSSSLSMFCLNTRGISSQAGSESGGEKNDLDNAVSELGRPNSDIIKESVACSPNELDLLDTVHQNADRKFSSKHKLPDIYKVIMSANHESLFADLDNWEQEGHSVSQSDISLTMLNLRMRRYYKTALQFSEWLEAKEKLEFREGGYASRLDLIAKVRGLVMAEKYFDDIPESFRGEVIYRTLLVNAVRTTNLKKAEAVFNKMRSLGIAMTACACNQMLLLYKRLDRKKIPAVLLFMEKENILPTLFTYRLLIDIKGHSNDIMGMQKLRDAMKEQGLEPDHTILAMLAKYYILAGSNEKAEAVLKEMEGGNLN